MKPEEVTTSSNVIAWFIFLSCLVFAGEPDLLDAIIHFIMNQ